MGASKRIRNKVRRAMMRVPDGFTGPALAAVERNLRQRYLQPASERRRKP